MYRWQKPAPPLKARDAIEALVRYLPAHWVVGRIAPGSWGWWITATLIAVSPGLLLGGLGWAIVGRPPGVTVVWAAIFAALTVLTLWLTELQIFELDQLAPHLQRLTRTDEHAFLKDVTRKTILPPPVALILAVALAIATAAAIGVEDASLLKGNFSPGWVATSAFTVFWVLTALGPFGGLSRLTWELRNQERKQQPGLALVFHAPERTVAFELLRAFADRATTRSMVVLALLSTPLAWSTVIAVVDDHDKAVLIPASIALFGLVAAWMTCVVGLAQWCLTDIASRRRARILEEIENEKDMPTTPETALAEPGTSMIALHEKVSEEHFGRSKSMTLLKSVIALVPIAVSLATAIYHL
jgi:hypothetical protein